MSLVFLFHLLFRFARIASGYGLLIRVKRYLFDSRKVTGSLAEGGYVLWFKGTRYWFTDPLQLARTLNALNNPLDLQIRYLTTQDPDWNDPKPIYPRRPFFSRQITVELPYPDGPLPIAEEIEHE